MNTTKATWTAGPWKQAIGPKLGETDIMALHSVTCIATVYTGVNGTDGDANARLIAAAPDLLEAVKLLQAALTEHQLRDVKKRYSLCVADAAASNALAKAEGR